MKTTQRGRNQYTGETHLDWLKEAIKGAGDACIIWPFPNAVTRGYGRLVFEGQKEMAHRAAYKLAYGRFPQPYGLHRCDCMLCVNPLHVFPGNQRDNMADRIAKGRPAGSRAHLIGQGNNNAKLTDENVLEIRRRLLTEKGQDLAEEFGITPSAISNIKNYKRWPHLR